MRLLITNAQALVLGSLLALGCSSDASGDSDGSSTDSTDSTGKGPVIAVSPGGGTPSSNTPTSPQIQSSSEVQPTPTLQPGPAQQPTSAQQPTAAEPSPQADPEQQSGAEQPPPSSGGAQPTIPAVAGECPDFRTGTITFMGLGGIQMVAGTKAAAATAPMVFYWHGTGSTSGEFGFMAGAVSDGVKAEGGILVSFQGTTGGDALSGTSVFGKGDINLVDQLAACAVRDFNVDPHRIFTTGCSAGGLFATNLAMLRSEYIAAAAPNSGGLTSPQKFQNDYTPALMTVHGAPGKDVVIVDFSNTSATADKAFKTRGGFVLNCNHGGGHCGGAGLAPDVWEFFEAHPYGVEPAPSPWTAGLPSDFSSQCTTF